MNIILIGMRGSGKTTVALLMAKKLDREFIDMDQMIVKKNNISIQRLVTEYGWDYFRKKEVETVKEVSQRNNTVIATGGGVVVNAENVRALKKNGKFVYLQAPVKILLQRINIDPERPPLTDKKSPEEEMEELLKQRKQLYENAADEIIDTEVLSPEETVNIIIEKLKVKL
ncbi:MAG: shikimate kinase [Candidatus Levyibacteriota bacterium]